MLLVNVISHITFFFLFIYSVELSWVVWVSVCAKKHFDDKNIFPLFSYEHSLTNFQIIYISTKLYITQIEVHTKQVFLIIYCFHCSSHTKLWEREHQRRDSIYLLTYLHTYIFIIFFIVINVLGDQIKSVAAVAVITSYMSFFFFHFWINFNII